MDLDQQLQQEALNVSSMALMSKENNKSFMHPMFRKICCLVVLIVLCFLLIILLCVILAVAGTAGGSYLVESEKMWIFAVAHHDLNIAYIDNRTGAIHGYNVDVINAVCEIAEKRCDVVWDIEVNCWDSSVGESPRGGVGLFNRWYDGCAGWTPTKARNRTFKFTKSYFKTPSEILWVKNNDTSFSRAPPINIAGKKVGFVDGWHSDEFCLQLQPDILGFTPQSSYYKHYPTVHELVNGVQNNEIDAAFCSFHPYLKSQLQPLTSSTTCATQGPAVMCRKDSKLIDWWNESFDKLVGSNKYDVICQDLQKAHGHKQGADPSMVCIGY